MKTSTLTVAITVSIALGSRAQTLGTTVQPQNSSQTDPRSIVLVDGYKLQQDVGQAIVLVASLDKELKNATSSGRLVVPVGFQLALESMRTQLQTAQKILIQGLTDVQRLPSGCQAKREDIQAALDDGVSELTDVIGKTKAVEKIAEANERKWDNSIHGPDSTAFITEYQDDMYAIAQNLYSGLWPKDQAAMEQSIDQFDKTPMGPSCAVQSTANAAASAPDVPYAEQDNLDQLQVSADGTLYRMAPDHPGWDLMNPTMVIQKAVPDNTTNALYNKKGEFTGKWQSILKTTANSYQIVTGKDGVNHLYTFHDRSTDLLGPTIQDVYRDGDPNPIAIVDPKQLPPNTNVSDLHKDIIKVGPDGSLYEWYMRDCCEDSESTIFRQNPPSQKPVLAAEVPLYRCGKNQYCGIDDFRIAPNGDVLALYKGNIIKPNADGNGTVVVSAASTGSGQWTDPIRGFNIDPAGNIYYSEGNRIHRMGNGADNGIDLGWVNWDDKNIQVDGQGNAYVIARNWFDTYIKKINLSQNPGTRN